MVSLFTVWWEGSKPKTLDGEVSKLKTLDGEVRFPCLVKLMTSLLTIPVSYSDSERDF